MPQRSIVKPSKPGSFARRKARILMATENIVVPGAKLQEIRKAAGLSRKNLEEKSGVGWEVIKKYEIGARDINIARVDIVRALAQALNCKIEDLLDE